MRIDIRVQSLFETHLCHPWGPGDTPPMNTCTQAWAYGIRQTMDHCLYFRMSTSVQNTQIVWGFFFWQNEADPLCCWLSIAFFVRKYVPLDVSNKIVRFKLFMNVHLDRTTRWSNSLVSSRKRLDERPTGGWMKGGVERTSVLWAYFKRHGQ